MAALAPLALDEYDFASLRQAGQAYVDKTAHIQRMLAEPIKYAFLARPRRFGKSLLVSTLAHLFSRTDDALFQDLAIAAYVPQVPRRPVVLLDMSLGVGHTAAQVHEALMHIVREQARRFGFVLRETPDTTPWVALSRLCSQLEQAYGKFVVLVDEYDAALAELLAPSVADAPASQAIQASLRHFYRTLKTWNRAIQFVFITGVLDIRGSGLFSALNNLVNLSADPDYDAICGFTEAETQRFFRPHLATAARHFAATPRALRARLQAQYNGYRFSSAASEPVYNPISYLTVLRQLTRPQYAVQVRAQGFPQPWIETGQTHFLFRYLQARGQPLTENDISESGVRDALDVQRPTLNALLFQAGYVTFARAPGQRTLGFPNLEVRTAFYAGLFRHWFREPAGRGSRIFKLIRAMGRAFEARDCGAGLAAFDQMLDGMNYALLRAESHFQIAFQILCEVASDILNEPRDLHAASERLTRWGRTDLVIETRHTFYVIEMKVNRNVAAALEPMARQDCLGAFARRGKRVVGLGANFDKPTGDTYRDASQANYQWATMAGPDTTLEARERGPSPAARAEAAGATPLTGPSGPSP